MHDFLANLLGAKVADNLTQVGLNLLLALLVLLIGIWLSARLANLVQRALQRASVDITLIGFLRKVVYGLLIAVLVVIALNMAGVSTAPLVAALGAAGLAIGLALQGSLSNLAWGVLLVIFRPFRVGDYVTAGGIDGTVESINLMHTLLLLPDGREAIVPNGKIGSDAILNYNRRGTRRFDFTVRIGFKDDIGAAMAEIRHLFEQDERILKDPAPGVWTSELGESSVDLIVRAWTRSGDFWAAKTDLLRAIKDHFDKVGISIPLPQRQLTVVEGKLPDAAAKHS
ncbi:mechanosensitive ion channel protein MscS [Rhodanobacter sp. B05]|uniref:mechanosensitive ion channel family protein n=1 Tax=Rhodanobacter sp. B05 TaxID=1945859 RepID=UPI000984BAEA|nr:mechanosensitive ion channel domain-containing protein [Rhodanobacter sp. B05]OOG57095.1 mechanosensitive ion channel protein MscS [Rhodanobacter sp. B05]